MFHYFKQRKERKRRAKELYDIAVDQARQTVFYTDYGVPDTIDGRFELVLLHNYILVHRLSWNGEVKQSQALFDAFFVNMEHSLREMGIGDLAVPKHMKRMMQGFNGRSHSYESAIKSKDNQALVEAIRRNVYGTVEEPDENHIIALADYMERSIALETKGAEFAKVMSAPATAPKLSA